MTELHPSFSETSQQAYASMKSLAVMADALSAEALKARKRAAGASLLAKMAAEAAWAVAEPEHKGFLDQALALAEAQYQTAIAAASCDTDDNTEEECPF